MSYIEKKLPGWQVIEEFLPEDLAEYVPLTFDKRPIFDNPTTFDKIKFYIHETWMRQDENLHYDDFLVTVTGEDQQFSILKRV